MTSCSTVDFDIAKLDMTSMRLFVRKPATVLPIGFFSSVHAKGAR